MAPPTQDQAFGGLLLAADLGGRFSPLVACRTITNVSSRLNTLRPPINWTSSRNDPRPAAYSYGSAFGVQFSTGTLDHHSVIVVPFNSRREKRRKFRDRLG